MASDWIKVRSDLPQHPRFIALTKALIGTDNFVQFVFGYNKTRNDCVTTQVTQRALRSVTQSLLMQVWFAVNAHSKLTASGDAELSPMAIDDLDELSGYEGFGRALETVGWVVVKDAQTIVFPNFAEHNDPSSNRRGVAKSNAQRQREFRARQKAKLEAETTVTERNACNGREEKSREEIYSRDKERSAGARIETSAHPQNQEIPDQAPSDPESRAAWRNRNGYPELEQAKATAPQAGKTPEHAAAWWNCRDADDWLIHRANGTATRVSRNWQADMARFQPRSRTGGSNGPSNQKSVRQRETEKTGIEYKAPVRILKFDTSSE